MAAKADINKIKKIKKRRRKKEHFPGMWLKTENIQLFKKYPLFFFFFYRYSYLYLNVNRSKVVITICWTMQRSQSVHLICYNKQWLRLAVLTVFTSPCVPQSTLRVRFDHHSLAGEKAWIDLWKENTKTTEFWVSVYMSCVLRYYTVYADVGQYLSDCTI